jgi:DNA replication protein DnaC
MDPEDIDIPIRQPGSPDQPVELPRERPVCPICKGVGYLSRRMPAGGFELVPCDCKRRELEERDYQKLQTMSNLDAFAEKTFDTFDATIPGVERAYRICQEYATSLQGGEVEGTDQEGLAGPQKLWLLLMGQPGCGKTHLAAAIANEALDRHIHTLFTIVPDMLDHLRSSYAPDSPIRFDERIEAVRTIYLLVLDDLGTENASPWAGEKLYQIINYRYNHRLPTVITTNRQFEAIEPRILSRIVDVHLCTVAKMTAGDYRLGKARAESGAPGSPGRRPAGRRG